MATELAVDSAKSVATACLLCGQPLTLGSRSYFDTRFGSSGVYFITQCVGCGLEQTLPRPEPEQLRHLYESYYNFSGETGTSYTGLRERFLNSWLYRLWLAIDGDISFHSRRGRGDLLDYGCNEGRGLAIYKANGYRVEGLEWNSKAAELARHRGFTVWNQDLEDWHAPHLYDVIVLSNVLEHALDPARMLARIKTFLQPKGQLWISCPNNKSFLRQVFGRFWINWHVPFHILHFSGHTLSKLLQKTGYLIIRVGNETPALWFTQSMISRLFAKPGRPTRQLRSVFYVLPLMIIARFILFPIFWLANHRSRGDCLILIAENKQA